jgi:hypothetical protein
LFSKTSVAAEPWPRRLAAESPLVPRWAPLTTSAFEARFSGPVPLVLRNASICSGLVMPSRVKSSTVTICKGSEELLGSRLMREPVTIMALSPAVLAEPSASVSGVSAPVGVEAGCVGSSCALAGDAMTSAASAQPVASAIRCEIFERMAAPLIPDLRGLH